MTQASDLWTSVKANYPTDALISLTNIRNRAGTSIDDTTGTNAAQAVIDLWPVYAQADYDAAVPSQVEIARQAVIAMLFRRGGVAQSIEQVKWDEVFGTDGAIARFKRTDARGRVAPVSNSGVKQSAETLSDGSRARPWSDPSALPTNYLPSRRSADDDA